MQKLRARLGYRSYTIMDFSAGVHDVICTRKKNNIDRGGSRGQYLTAWVNIVLTAWVNIVFLVQITLCTPAEKVINVLLYIQPVL